MKDKIYKVIVAVILLLIVLHMLVASIYAPRSDEKRLGDKISTEELKCVEYDIPSDFKALDCAMDIETQKYVYYMCQNYGIDFYFTMALIETESECDSTKIGHNKNNTKDYGLMQINSCNLKWISKEFGETDLSDSIQNINVGMTILYDLFQKYDGEPNLVLMAYNMGEGGAKALWENGIYETEYVRQVNANLEKFKGESDEY